eukprot:6199363-Pleurochrysis_carterae.AAC.4
MGMDSAHGQTFGHWHGPTLEVKLVHRYELGNGDGVSDNYLQLRRPPLTCLLAPGPHKWKNRFATSNAAYVQVGSAGRLACACTADNLSWAFGARR